MKSILTALLLFTGLSASALEVGDAAPCVVINHIQTDNTESEHCIRDRAQDQKFTIVEFFSISCSACQANLPKLAMLGNSVLAEATTRMISIDRDETSVRSYITTNRQDLPFEIALDSSRDAKKAYSVVQTPTLFVLDESLNIAYKHEGVLTSKDIQHIQTIVKQQ